MVADGFAGKMTVTRHPLVDLDSEAVTQAAMARQQPRMLWRTR